MLAATMQRTIAVLIVLALAGCISEPDPPVEPEPEPLPEPMVEPTWARAAVYGPDHAEFGPGDPVGHDHSDRAAHAWTTPNFEVLGWDPLVTDRHGMSAGGYYCGEVSKDGEQKLAVVNSFTSQVAMVVLDVTDPMAPEYLGELVLTNAQIYDSAITDDGQFAILATSPLITAHEDDERADRRDYEAGARLPAPDADALAGLAASQDTITVQPIFRDRCGNEYQGPEDELPVASGIALIDIRDPTVPSVEDFVSQPAIGPHSVSATTIDGTRYAVASVTNLVYTASFFSVFTVEELAGQGKLAPFVEYSANYDQQVQGTNPLLNGHVDATLHDHPDGLILWVANWDGGLHSVRIDGPGQTTLLDVFGERTQAPLAGRIHSAEIVGERDGRTYILTGQEVGSNMQSGDHRRPTGQVVLLDVTDPADLSPVAKWTLPVDVAWSGNLHMSTHYMHIIGDTLFVANYHNGVWAADASPEQWPDLPSIGVFMPSSVADEGIRTDTSYAPYVLDLQPLADGSLLVFDGSGAYTVAFTGRHPDVPPATPWPQEFIG